ncbi:MAG TPA: hypothetical protein VFC90_09800 [Planctomycetota bacterium]|nr:hypothetical protein [Planctomycetota bacterium]
MKLVPALLLLAFAACQSSSGNSSVDSAEAIFKAPKASTGSGIDPDTQGAIMDNPSEVKSPKPELGQEPSFQFKEITVDPKDARTRIDLVRTLLGEEWMPISKVPKGDGVEVWKFMRRDASLVDVDPFGIPDIHKSTKEPIKPVK